LIEELFRSDGKVIGKFIPEQAPPPNISEEELRHREVDRTSKTYSAAEVEAKIREWRWMPNGE